MRRQNKNLGLNFRFVNWKLVLISSVLCSYLAILGINILNGTFHSIVYDDYLAFWSAGKIADEVGYKNIYDLNYLKSFQELEYKRLGYISYSPVDFIPTPVPYLAIFILPFQFLSRLPVNISYWIWTVLNSIILIGYLIYFYQEMRPPGHFLSENLPLIIFVLFSWAAIVNVVYGQVGVFLLVCIGEFLRNGIKGRPVLSGLWLGGLLLKPQLIILILPMLFFMHNWKSLKGFFISSAPILIISLFLSGFSGLKALLNLLIKYSVGRTYNAAETMINWRMVGVILNCYLDSSSGWVLTIIGISLTILAVFYLIKNQQSYGSPQWVMTMLGVFSATLAVTWHSHYHMAMVLIPLLLYTTVNKLLPDKFLIWWVIVTPISLLVALIINLFVPFIEKIFFYNYLSVFALAGFIINLVILFKTVQVSGRDNIESL